MKVLHKEGSMAGLEQLATPLLEDMLRAEAVKECPDAPTVRAIMRILRQRASAASAQTDTARKEFRPQTGKKAYKPLLRAAAIAVVCGLMLAVFAQQASAGRFWERLAAWSDSIFELFGLERRGRSSDEYEFRTDNPGLQELYDTVTELGVTVPIVPMWLDGEYELEKCKITESRSDVKVLAALLCDDKTVNFDLKIYEESVSREFHKDELDAEPYESNGVIHYIFQNHDAWIVVWTRNNVECNISIDCRDDVHRVINSIYTSEE